MSEQTRYRVTGAIFLIALGVIVLPMLFDGEGLETQDVAPMREDVAPPAEVAEVAPAEDSAFTDVQKLRESVDTEGFVHDTGTRVGEPVLSDAEQGAVLGTEAAFGVQLASFTDRANAVALRDRVRADGYPALLSEVKRDDQRITRVAVGPYVARKDAEKLRDELSTRYSVKAIVVGFAS